MDKPFLIIIISIAIILCLLIVNFINEKKEKYINHGGFFTNNKNNDNIVNLNCGDTLKMKQGEKYSFRHEELNKLKIIVEKIISKINKKLKLNFRFTEIDYLTKHEFGDGNIRYLIELFMNEYIHHYNRRLMIDIFIDNKTKNITINKIVILQNKKDKSNQLKSKQGKFSEKILGFNKEQDIIQGLNDSNLEFNILEYKPKHFKNKNFTDWILPNEAKQILNNNLTNNKWDKDGILEDNKKRYNNLPKFLPNFKNINYNSNLNWIFGTSNGTGGNMFRGGRGYSTSN